jgi:hypothetical protein
MAQSAKRSLPESVIVDRRMSKKDLESIGAIPVSNGFYGLPLSKRLYTAVFRRLDRWFGVKALLIYQRPLIVRQEIPAQILEQYSFREISTLEQATFARDLSLRLAKDFVDKANKRGDVCIGAFFGNQLVAYRWYAISGLAPYEENIWIRNTDPRQAYGYKMFTVPRHRGRRLQLYTMIYGDARMLERGFTYAMNYVAAHNFSSRRGLSRIREKKLVGIVGCVRLLGHDFIVRTPSLKQYGFQFERRDDADARALRTATS